MDLERRENIARSMTTMLIMLGFFALVIGFFFFNKKYLEKYGISFIDMVDLKGSQFLASVNPIAFFVFLIIFFSFIGAVGLSQLIFLRREGRISWGFFYLVGLGSFVFFVFYLYWSFFLPLLDCGGSGCLKVFFFFACPFLSFFLFHLFLKKFLWPGVRELSKKIKDLEKVKIKSENWTNDVWRKKEIKENHDQYYSNPDFLYDKYDETRHKEWFWDIFKAYFFLGRDWWLVRGLLKKNTEEYRIRWELVTGKKIPKE